MPRPRVLEEYRQRIAKACLYCQATKQKCDAQAPCVQCHKRGRSSTCAYPAHERSYGRRPRKHLEAAREPTSTGHAAFISSHRTRPPENDSMEQWACRTTAVAVPKLPHNLYDTKGRVCTLSRLPRLKGYL
jgi:hypothetical protein